MPSKPNSGYGYIKRGNGIGQGFVVDRFVEKPSLEVAQGYISSGEYYWNSGMFLFRASSYIEELKKHRPDILEQCKASVLNVKADLDFLRINKEMFESCPAESIDYAVLEKTSHQLLCRWMRVGVI